MTTTDPDEIIANYRRLGREELPATFLGTRDEWLAAPGSVRVQENEHGDWDIALCIDGSYGDETMARDFADQYQAEVHGLAEQFRRNPDLWRGYEDEAPCPACGKESILCRRLDRFLHMDGSDNDWCWVTMLRGEFSDVQATAVGNGR